MNDKRIFTKCMLVASFLLLCFITVVSLYWMFTVEIRSLSDLVAVTVIGAPLALIGGYGKIFEQQYNRYMEKGVQLRGAVQTKTEIEVHGILRETETETEK